MSDDYDMSFITGPRIAISGPGRSGKDCVSEWLRDHTVLRYVAGTSWYAAPLVYERMTDRGFRYATVEDCWNDRHNYRQIWADVIGTYNSGDPARLYRDCIAKQDLLTGVRWRKEKQACEAAGLVKMWLWVERPGIPEDPTMEYTASECDLVILNDGALEDLYRKLWVFADTLGILKPSACRPVATHLDNDPLVPFALASSIRPQVIAMTPSLRVVHTDGTTTETGRVAGSLFKPTPRRA
jgi:hypothetical protein